MVAPVVWVEIELSVFDMRFLMFGMAMGVPQIAALREESNQRIRIANKSPKSSPVHCRKCHELMAKGPRASLISSFAFFLSGLLLALETAARRGVRSLKKGEEVNAICTHR